MNRDPDDPSHARVRPGQLLLFPLSARQVCDKTALSWWAAMKLHADGWLSFDPEQATALDEAQEQELRFVGSLVTGGCNPALLGQLLSGLERPYCYAGRRIYYDWAERRWRLIPEPNANAAGVFADWLESLKDEGNVAQLEAIKAEVEAALALLHQAP